MALVKQGCIITGGKVNTKRLTVAVKKEDIDEYGMFEGKMHHSRRAHAVV